MGSVCITLKRVLPKPNIQPVIWIVCLQDSKEQFFKKTSGSLAMIKRAVSLFIENAWPSTDKEAHIQDQKVHPWLLNRQMSKPRFLNNDILDQIIVCFAGCLTHCSMFSAWPLPIKCQGALHLPVVTT